MWLSLRGKRVIYDAHEDLPNTFAYKYYIPAFARQSSGVAGGANRRSRGAALHGGGCGDADHRKRFSKYNTNTVVVRNFPSLAELALGVNLLWNERPPLVVYVGSMAPERGFREAMAAISLLPPI